MAEYNPIYDPFEGFGSEDMSTPEIRLVQNTGGQAAKDLGAKPGDFWFTLTDEIFTGKEGFHFVVVRATKARTYWGRDEIGEGPPECSSLDGITSRDGDVCQDCLHFTNNPAALDKEQRKKMCSLDYLVFAVERNSQLPVMFRVSGISVKNFRTVYSQFAFNPGFRSAPWSAFVHACSTEVETPYGKAFAWDFKAPQALSDAEEIETMKQIVLSTAVSAGAQLAAPEAAKELEAPTTPAPAPAPTASASLADWEPEAEPEKPPAPAAEAEPAPKDATAAPKAAAPAPKAAPKAAPKDGEKPATAAAPLDDIF